MDDMRPNAGESDAPELTHLVREIEQLHERMHVDFLHLKTHRILETMAKRADFREWVRETHAVMYRVAAQMTAFTAEAESAAARVAGRDAGLFVVSDSFDDPLPEDVLSELGG